MKKFIIALTSLILISGCTFTQKEKETPLLIKDITELREPVIIEGLVQHYETIKLPKNSSSVILSAQKNEFSATILEPSVLENDSIVTVTNFAEQKKELYKELKLITKYKRNYFVNSEKIFWYDKSYLYTYNSDNNLTEEQFVTNALSIRNNYQKKDPFLINLNGVKLPDREKHDITLHNVSLMKKPNIERAIITYSNNSSERTDLVDWSLAIESSNLKISPTSYEVELKNNTIGYFSNTDTGYDLEWEHNNYNFQLLCNEREKCINFANDLI